MFNRSLKVNSCKIELISFINLLHLTFHPLVKTRNLTIILDCSLSFALEFLDMAQSLSFSLSLLVLT